MERRGAGHSKFKTSRSPPLPALAGQSEFTLSCSPPPITIPIPTYTAAAQPMHRKLTTFSAEYRIQKLKYIKLPMYLFIIRHLDLIILMRENQLLRPFKGSGPWKSWLFGPWNDNKRNECHTIPQKQQNFKIYCAMDDITRHRRVR